MSPFFTVIIPTYNRAGLLQEAIQSVFNQTFEDFELIVVDDHSTDDTKNIVDAFCDNRIQYIVNNRTKGPSGTRNSGMLKARGKWIAFLDDDDVWLPQKLSLQYKKIQEVDHTTGLIYTGYASYDFDKKQEISRYIPDKKGWIQNDLLYKNYIGTISVVAIKNDILKKVDKMDENMYMFEDGEFYVRIAGSFKIDLIKDILTYYRTTDFCKLSLNSENALNGYKLFSEKHRKVINKSLRLRHRAASRIFIAAVQVGNMKEIVKILPWNFAGLIFDPVNFICTFRSILSIIYKKKILLLKK